MNVNEFVVVEDPEVTELVSGLPSGKVYSPAKEIKALTEDGLFNVRYVKAHPNLLNMAMIYLDNNMPMEFEDVVNATFCE